MYSNKMDILVLRVFGRGISVEKLRLLGFILSACVALYIGFFALDPARLGSLIKHGAYFFISSVFVFWVYYAIRAWRTRDLKAESGMDLAMLVWIAFCTLLLWGGDSFRYKLLFDEYVLQTTSMSLHLDRQLSTPIRAHWLEGSYLLMEGYLDKRPYFYSFLVSLVHDLTGYRVYNAILLNALLVPVLLWFTSRVVVFYSGRAAAFASVGLLGTLPILAQVCSSAGMEMLNLTMLVVVLHASVIYISKPSELRLGYLCLSTALLTQCRYESLIFLVSVAVIILLAWYRTGRASLPWVLILTPLLSVPAVWQSRYVDSNPVLWELKAGQVARFSMGYLRGNLEGMWNFMSSPDRVLPNSLFLGLLGVGGSALAVLEVLGRLRGRRGIRWEWAAVTSLYGAVLFVTGLFLFYYWARLDDIPACRFSLPLYLFLAFVGAASLSIFARGRAWVFGAFWSLWLVHLMGFYLPCTARRIYTDTNLISVAVAWETEFVNSLPKVPRLVVGDSVQPWVAHEYSVVAADRAAARAEEIEYHVREGTFQEVLVVQGFTPSSIDGDFVQFQGPRLPDRWTLKVLGMRRFGGLLIRISRVEFPDRIREAQGEARPLAQADQDPCTAAFASASESL